VQQRCRVAERVQVVPAVCAPDQARAGLGDRQLQRVDRIFERAVDDVPGG
jgi:hypothetical protein